MSVVNNLLRTAKATPRPDELVIRDNQVGSVVEHILGTTALPNCHRDDVEKKLRAGHVKLYGIPIRVIGQKWHRETRRSARRKSARPGSASKS